MSDEVAIEIKLREQNKSRSIVDLCIVFLLLVQCFLFRQPAVDLYIV